MASACVTNVTDQSFEQEVLRHSGVVLVDFYTQWCPPCKQVAPILEELCAERRPTLKIVKVDAGENPSVAADITAVPTFHLYRDGTKINQVSGYQSKAQFERWIDSSLSGA